MAHPDDSHLINALVHARAAGDDTAINAAAWALVEHHMGWIVTLRRTYERRWWTPATHEDFRSAFVEAAFRGVRRFDPTKGANVPTWIKYSTRKVAGYTDAASSPLGLRPGATAYARRTGGGATGLTAASIDATRFDGQSTLADELGIDDPDVALDLVQEAQAAAGAQLAALLPDRPWRRINDRAVLIRRFGLDGEPPESNLEIAERLGVSREATRLSTDRALDRLAHPAALRRIVRAGIDGTVPPATPKR